MFRPPTAVDLLWTNPLFGRCDFFLGAIPDERAHLLTGVEKIFRGDDVVALIIALVSWPEINVA
jgi:hypothetical protein